MSCQDPTTLLALDREELTADAARSVRQHTDACPGCREELALLRALRENTTLHISRFDGGRSCPDEMMLARFAEGRLDGGERSTTRDHLADCGYCLGLVEAACVELQAIRDRATATVTSRPGVREQLMAGMRALFTPPRLAWMAPAVAAVAVFIVALSMLTSEPDLAGLADVKPLPVRHVRAATDPDSFEGRFREGLRLYEMGDAGAAVSELDAAIVLRDDHAEAFLYLGSAHLLSGSAPAAIGAFRQAESIAPARLREEVLWQYAQALLVADDRGGSREKLQQVIVLEGRHADEARAVLRALD